MVFSISCTSSESLLYASSLILVSPLSLHNVAIPPALCFGDSPCSPFPQQVLNLRGSSDCSTHCKSISYRLGLNSQLKNDCRFLQKRFRKHRLSRC